MKRYVKVKLTPEMAFAVADAARESLATMNEANFPSEKERLLVAEAANRLMAAWRASQSRGSDEMA